MENNIQGSYNTAKLKLDKTLVEKECREQIQEMMNHEAFKGSDNVAIMPDTHWGAGAVIGFTKPLENRISPNTVGVDIGCGMYAANLGDTEITNGDKEILEELDKEIRDKVPMGFNVHDRQDYHFKDDFPWQKCQDKLETFNQNSEMPDIEADYGINYFKNLLEKIGYQTGRTINSMGTLGGGNHFIELGESQENGDTWCIIHSGSRGIGARIAEYWQNRATQLTSIEHVRNMTHVTIFDEENGEREVNLYNYVKFDEEDSDEDILDWMNGAKGESFKKEEKIRNDFDGETIEIIHDALRNMMPDKAEDNRNTDLDYLEGEEAAGYIRDMIFAQTYASESRKQMMKNVIAAVYGATGSIPEYPDTIESVHNYVDFEDQTIRKGACRAHKDEKIVIPFNMNYGTLIAEGKGKEGWNNSAPHGAGRAMSRTAAKEKYSEEDMADQTEGVYMSKNPVDETPKAYKDPEIVEEAIGETAEIVDRIVPVISLKAE